MRALLVVCLLFLTGCYTYAPVRVSILPQGTAIRTQLSVPSDFRLTELTANGVVSVDGEVVRQNQSELVVSAMWLRSQAGYEFPASGETVVIPAARIAVLQQKRISLLRSGAVVGAGALAGVLLIAAFGSGGGGGGSRGGNPTPQ